MDKRQVLDRAETLKEQIIADRRYLHQHAEFGMELPETVAYVKQRLMEMGYVPQDCAGGVIATVGGCGKTMLLRADMDALKVQEENDLPFRSESGISHMCGHDMHTAILLGAAQILKEHETELQGTIKLMFQPGEEVAAGAKAMVDAGVLENPKVDAAMSLHVITNVEDGDLTYTPGAAFSSVDIFQIEVSGRGGHGSAMELVVDPIHAVVQIYQSIEGIVARETSMFHSATCSIGHLEGGSMYNVIPQTALLEGTLRCYDREDRRRILDRMQRIVDGVCSAAGTKGSLKLTTLPMLVNDDVLCEQLVPILAEIDGLRFYQNKMPSTASEDFSFVSEAVPTMYLMLGVGGEGQPVNHNPKALFSEEHIHLGSAAFAYAAMKWLV